MPAKFHQIAPTVWDRTMRRLSPQATVVRLYVMSCANRITEGLFQLPLGIIVHDTGLAEDEARSALDELEEAGLVSYDEDAEVVLDRTALKYAPLKHGRHPETGEVRRNSAMKSAVKLFAGVPPTPLKRELYLLAKHYADDFAVALVEHDPTLGLDPGDAAWNGDSAGRQSTPGQRGVDPGSRGEASRGEVSRGGACRVEACDQPAVYRDSSDGSPLCEQHSNATWGEALDLGQGA